MSANLSNVRHVRGFDVIKPLSIFTMVALMLPLILLPLASMFTAAIILANIFVTFPLAFGVIKPVFETMSHSLEEASATMSATRWQTFWHVTLPSLRGAIVTGVLLTFARRRRIRLNDSRFGQSRNAHANRAALYFR